MHTLNALPNAALDRAQDRISGGGREAGPGVWNSYGGIQVARPRARSPRVHLKRHDGTPQIASWLVRCPSCPPSSRLAQFRRQLAGRLSGLRAQPGRGQV